MVKLNFNVRGYVFEQRVRVLRESYKIAAEALEERVRAETRKLSEYRTNVEDGGEWIGERDEEGNLIWSQDQLIEFDIEIARKALSAMRKSYMIAIYHTWEIAIQTLASGENFFGSGKLEKHAKSKGIFIHPDLKKIRNLVNLLKHHNSETGGKLLKSWNEIFPPNFQSREHVDWYDAVELENSHIDWACDVVLSSGPSKGSLTR